MFTMKRVNHAGLWVRSAERAGEFYQKVLGFSVVESLGGQALFLRANGSDNHHDLGLFSIGDAAPPPSRGDRVGLYHLAWEVESITDLAEARRTLIEAR